MSATAPFRLDRRAVERSFNRASGQHAAAAPLQTRVGAELLERLQFFDLKPRVILDLGCGVGTAAAQLRRRFPRSRVVAIDSAYLMTREARRRQHFWRRFECVCADARALPLAGQSVDLVFSNLMLQWCDDPAALFAQMQRVLRPGGLILYSTLGPDTLHELRTAWSSADTASHVSAFADITQLAAAMSHSGLSEPVMDRELQLAHYPDVHALMSELRTLGAQHAAADRRRSLTGRSRMQRMLDAYESMRTAAGIPASWEIIYGAGFAGTARPDTSGTLGAGEYAVPLGAVRSRGKSL
ncbi:MAG TPA: malonyl-ACP O-methyltransferase BioC [Steroidobacteraceae bacterium]|nr:malonyl-ACP O-methyltransferase BioC [Steroidobacteraceae bacterium]